MNLRMINGLLCKQNEQIVIQASLTDLTTIVLSRTLDTTTRGGSGSQLQRMSRDWIKL
jgi:hypothetical protein